MPGFGPPARVQPPAGSPARGPDVSMVLTIVLIAHSCVTAVWISRGWWGMVAYGVLTWIELARLLWLRTIR